MDDHSNEQKPSALTDAISIATHHAKAVLDRIGLAQQSDDFYRLLTADLAEFAASLSKSRAAANALFDQHKNLTLTPGGDVLMLASVAAARLIEEDGGGWYLSCMSGKGTVLAEWECESESEAKMDALRVLHGKRMTMEQGQAPERLRDIEVAIPGSSSAAGAN